MNTVIKAHACDIHDFLKNRGLRKTKDRHAIVSRFLDQRAWSVPQLAKLNDFTYRSTVYHNIKKLLEKKIIKPIHSHKGEQFYEWANQEHHDHIDCIKCEIIECIPCPAPKLKKHILELQDICSYCK